MAHDEEAHEQTQLLKPHTAGSHKRGNKLLNTIRNDDASSIISSCLSKEEQLLHSSAIGERLPYNDYTTIDWLHDLIKDSYRHRSISSRQDIRGRLIAAWDSSQGWVAACMIGCFTAIVAFLVDIAEAIFSDYKEGYCSSNIFRSRGMCCARKSSGLKISTPVDDDCLAWKSWTENYWSSFAIYIGFALIFGIIAGAVTMTTKATLPSASSNDDPGSVEQRPIVGKSMYMAAGSGIPEIKTILSGFVIPHFLDFKILLVKAIGATFAVATGLCLGKEGPFVHISTCVGHLVASLFPKYRDNGRKMREILSVACSSGLSVAFGAPIGGVLFAYEEISTYFPRPVLFRAFLCSLTAAIVLKALNPTGTGKLVLFETNYGTSYSPIHYLVFIFLGLSGGLFGGLFCKANFLWSRYFRALPLIRSHPVLEVTVVVLVTALFQYPNPLTRQAGDVTIKNLLSDCRHAESSRSWICVQESLPNKAAYYTLLTSGTLTKLLLTIITFGTKVPSGIIIPALDAGALFGRLVGQAIPSISPGIFAMVGAAAFLAGVSRMTVSLTVIMFELTGEVDYIPPFMIAILVAKWTADSLGRESVYDLAQTVLGHPFLDIEHALSLVRHGEGALVEDLIPPKQTMDEITLQIGVDHRVPKHVLSTKLAQLKARGLMDAGLVLVDRSGSLHGYLAQSELEFALTQEGVLTDEDTTVDLVDGPVAQFVDRTPLTVFRTAPMEYAVEMFGKLGLRYLVIVEGAEGGGRVVGVVIKKRLVLYLEGLSH